MISTTCACGAEFNVPGSFVNEPLECEHCKAKLILVAAEGHADEVTGRIQIRSEKKQRAQQYLLGGDGPLNLGRLPENEICLDGDRISRQHCILSRSAFGWFIQDNGSRNGVVINGKLAKGHDLSDGDIVQLGDVEFVFADLAPQMVPAAVPPTVPAKAEMADAEEAAVELQDADLVEADLVEADMLEEIPAEALNIPIAKPAKLNQADDDFFALAPDHAPAKPKRPQTEVPMDGPVCPSCNKRLQRNAKICVACGIDVKTGRAIITSKGFDENELAIRCDTWIRVVSWLVWFGLYPVASEAFGTKKPYTIWATAIVTFIASVLFFMTVSSGDGWQSAKNLMLWTGDPVKAKLRAESIERKVTQQLDDYARHHHATDSESAETRELVKQQLSRLNDPGEFHVYQLFTNTLLHDTTSVYRFLMHFGGNTLFLLVLGSGVNSLIGNAKTAIIYPVLGILASLAVTIMGTSDPLHANLGASGAIMGLAGMYLVLFPVHIVHMAIWLRVRFKCFYKVWPVRGFWVVLFYIAFDIFATLRGAKDGVAHWAHLGGFIAGIIVALILLLTRMVDARGGDLLTAILGQKAWAILGKPSDRAAVAA